MLGLLAQVDLNSSSAFATTFISRAGERSFALSAKTLEAALERVGGGKVTVTDQPMFVGSDGGLAIGAGCTRQRLGSPRELSVIRAGNPTGVVGQRGPRRASNDVGPVWYSPGVGAKRPPTDRR